MICNIPIIIHTVVHLSTRLMMYLNKRSKIERREKPLIGIMKLKTKAINTVPVKKPFLPVGDPLQFVLSEWTGRLYAADPCMQDERETQNLNPPKKK